MLDRIKNFFKKEEVSEVPIIHPDFNTIDPAGFWRWNYGGDFGAFQKQKLENKEKHLMSGTPDFKIAFGFDDPTVLEKCPFIGKIGKNDNHDTKYWAVFYGAKEDFEGMKNWAAQFTDKLRVLDYHKDGFVEIDPGSNGKNENMVWVGNRLIIKK
jgi:hypothetical protein